MRPLAVTQKALKWLFFWTGFGALFGVLDAWRTSKHDGTSVSEILRAVFQTHTNEGKIAFGAILFLLAFLFLWHIVG